MNRVVQAELLDHLSPDTDEAQRSRGDLRRINRVMGHFRRWPRLLASLVPEDRTHPWQVVELGAGDAELTAESWRRLPPPPPGSRLVLVDQQKVVAKTSVAALTDHGWIVEPATKEVGTWLRTADEHRVDLIYSNLFLHHFGATALPQLLNQISECTRAFACLEPRRSVGGLFAVRWLPFLGCNSVTRHDARCSVLAGFCHQEISESWPDPRAWRLQEASAGLFSHQFYAVRTHI